MNQLIFRNIYNSELDEVPGWAIGALRPLGGDSHSHNHGH